MEKGILIMVLTGAHYIYIIFMVIILITMILKKESVVPCVLGIFFLGLFFTKNIVGALNGVFNSFVVALNELGGIILIIGIMVALSKALEENHAIDFMAITSMCIDRCNILTNSNTFRIASYWIGCCY